MESAIPLFLLVRDRLTSLRKVLKSWERFEGQVTPVIVDMGTTYPPTLRFFADMHVLRGGEQLPDAEGVIQNYVEHHGVSCYAVSDPDIVLPDSVPADFVSFFVSLVQEGRYENVGPELHMDDIPEFYPYRDLVERKCRLPLSRLKRVDVHGIPAVEKRIVSSLGFYRRAVPWRFDPLASPSTSLRVMGPYMVRHEDWYTHPFDIPLDYLYYLEHLHPRTNAPRIPNAESTHWGRWIRKISEPNPYESALWGLLCTFARDVLSPSNVYAILDRGSLLGLFRDGAWCQDDRDVDLLLPAPLSALKWPDARWERVRCQPGHWVVQNLRFRGVTLDLREVHGECRTSAGSVVHPMLPVGIRAPSNPYVALESLYGPTWLVPLEGVCGVLRENAWANWK